MLGVLRKNRMFSFLYMSCAYPCLRTERKKEYLVFTWKRRSYGYCDLKFCIISSNVLFTLLLASPSLFVTLSCSPWHALLPKMQFKDSSGDCNPKHCKESATRGFIMHTFSFYKMESDLLSSHHQVCLQHQCLYSDIY